MSARGWSDRDAGYKRLQAEMFKLRDRGIVSVGIQGAEAEAQHDESGVTNGQVGMWFEWGTATQPARSFIRATADENGIRFYELIQRLLAGVIDGKRGTQEALAILGESVLAAMRNKLRSGVPPPLAQSTIDKKGSSKPGIDSSEMLKSLTYVVRSKDDATP